MSHGINGIGAVAVAVVAPATPVHSRLQLLTASTLAFLSHSQLPKAFNIMDNYLRK